MPGPSILRGQVLGGSGLTAVPSPGRPMSERAGGLVLFAAALDEHEGCARLGSGPGGSLPLNHHSRVCGPERVGAGPSDESARGEGAETERYADHLTTLKRALIEYRQPIRGVYRPNRLPQFMPEGHSSPLTSAESTQAPLGASFRSDMLCRIPSVAPSPDSVEISGLPAVDVAPRKPH